jgi:2-oxoisovalerate dehydrogenase E1 component
MTRSWRRLRPRWVAKIRQPCPEVAARDALFAKDARNLAKPVTLAKSINFALADLMLRYPNVSLFGEDVARKGGVYGVTQGLQDKFGAARVFDTLLDEQTILGLAIGMGHNGFVPIPEIQFLAYLHNAEDQIRGEAATLSFFSNQQYRNPMVVRIAGLPYQKGFGGHFHNDNSLAVLTDIPGIIVAVPSCAADAPAMLRECVRLAHEDGRVIVFVEPIALYHTTDLVEAGDGGWTANYTAPAEAHRSRWANWACMAQAKILPSSPMAMAITSRDRQRRNCAPRASTCASSTCAGCTRSTKPGLSRRWRRRRRSSWSMNAAARVARRKS